MFNNSFYFTVSKGKKGIFASSLKFGVCVLSIFLFLGSISCKKKLKDNELARIEELSVSKAHFVSAFKEYYYRSGRALTPSKKNKKAVLEAEFSPYVLTTYAKEKGWDQDAKSKHRLGMIRRKVYAEEYREHFVFDSIRVTPNKVRELFVRFNTTLRASHIYARNREKADSLYRALQNGASFDSLAARTFRNKYMAKNGGDIGTFSVNDVDLAFEDVAYNLQVGEVSKPVKTAQGFSIIKLTERHTKPIIPRSKFASKKDHIRKIARSRAEERATRRHLKRVTRKLNLDAELLDKLWQKVKRQKDQFRGLQAYREDLRLDIGPLADKDLAQASSFTFTGSDFLQEAFYTPREARSRIYRKYEFTDFVKGLAFRSYVIEKFRKTDVFNDSSIQASVNETFYNYLNNRVLDTLRANIQLSEKALRREFRKNPYQYKKPLKLNLARIVVSSEAEGRRVVKKLRQGVPFKDVLREHTINSEDLMTNGELGFQSVRKLGPMAPKVKEITPGQIKGPFKYHSNKYYVYKCLGKKPSRRLSFEEARDKVRKTLKRKKLQKKKQKLIERTKKRHDALVDLKKLEKLTIKI